MNPRRHSRSSLTFGVALGLTALSSLSLVTRCASSGPVGITKSEAMVSGCAKLGEVTVEKKVPESDVNDALAAEARKQKGNYVVVGADGARTGVAYRCTTPSTAASR